MSAMTAYWRLTTCGGCGWSLLYNMVPLLGAKFDPSHVTFTCTNPGCEFHGRNFTAPSVQCEEVKPAKEDAKLLQEFDQGLKEELAAAPSPAAVPKTKIHHGKR